MKTVTQLLLCVNLLVLGVLLGQRGGDWGGKPVEAQDTAGHSAEPLPTRSPLIEASDLMAKIVRQLGPSVVHIETEHRTFRGRRTDETGSGVIVRSPKQGEFVVVTNSHVIDGADVEDISVHLSDKRVLKPLKKLQDRPTDVAVLLLAERDLQAARLGDSEKLQIGHMVLAMGSPFGLSQSTTLGIISAKGRRALKISETSDMLNQDFLQTDAAINPGNSGGPLIDMQGQVIGINSAIASNSGGNEGIGFSIPSNLVRTVVDQLLSTGRVVRAYLGVSLDPDFNAQKAAKLKLDRVRGARVVNVNPNTPAAKAKLQEDDVVLTYDGIEVQDENHLINLVSLTTVGRRVKMVVLRAGKYLTMEVIVGDREQLDKAEGPAPQDEGIRVDQLGLTVHELSDELVAQLKFAPQTRGLLILKVSQQLNFAQEIRPYDVISAVGDSPVSTVAELEDALERARDRDEVVLKLKRRDQGQVSELGVIYSRR